MAHNTIYIGKKTAPAPSTLWLKRKTSIANANNGAVTDIDPTNDVDNNFLTNYRILGTPPVTVTLNDGGVDRVICAWNDKIAVLGDDGTTPSVTGIWEDNDILGAPLAYHALVKITSTNAVYIAYGRQNPAIGGSTVYCKARLVTLSGSSLIFGSTITLAKSTWAGDGQITPTTTIAGKLNVTYIGQNGGSNYYLFAWDGPGFTYNAQVLRDIEDSSWFAGPAINGTTMFGTAMENTGRNEMGDTDLSFHTIAKNDANNTWMQYATADPVTLVITPTGPNLDLEDFIGSPTTTVLQSFAFEILKTGLADVAGSFYFLTGWNSQEWIFQHDLGSGYDVRDDNGSNPTMNATIYNETASSAGSYSFVTDGGGNGRTHVYFDDVIGTDQTFLIFSIGISQANRYISATNTFQQKVTVNEDSAGDILSDRNSAGGRGINIFDTSYQIARVTNEKLYIIYTKEIPSTNTIGIRAKVVNKGN